jgi:beta-1,4-mannosyltransferase
MKIWMLPKYNPTNQYNELFSTSLENQNVQVFSLNKKSLFKPKKNDVIHIHWPSYFYSHQNIIFFFIKSFIFLFFLNFYKINGVKLVWTVHNIYPHNMKYKILEKIMRQYILNRMDLVFVCAYSIKVNILSEFKISSNKVVVLYHGHYVGAYPENGIDFRKFYGIPAKNFVFLYFGSINEYKGIPKLIESFNKINDSATLLIVGKPTTKELENQIKKDKTNKNIIFDMRFIPDDEVADLFNVANFIVLPYKEITTSGTAILSLSFKKPIIAPKTPFMLEYFNSNISILYDSNDNQGLYKSLIKAFNSKEIINDELFEMKLKDLDWGTIGRKAINEYKKI